jgi:hypothetical protein
LRLAKSDPFLPARRAFKDSICATFFGNFLRLYVSGFRYNKWPESMWWRLVITVAIVEVLVCLVPIEVAGIIALFRPWLFGG